MKNKNIHIFGYKTCAFSMKRENAPWKVRDGCENPLRLFTGKYYALPYSSACTTCPYYCRDENISNWEK